MDCRHQGARFGMSLGTGAGWTGPRRGVAWRLALTTVLAAATACICAVVQAQSPADAKPTTAGPKATSVAAAAWAAKGVFIVPAWAYDRGNLKTFLDTYADAGPVVANGNEFPNQVEYDIELPVAAEWAISIRYAADSPRPVDFLLDGTKLGQACRTATGSWNSSGRAHARTRLAAG